MHLVIDDQTPVAGAEQLQVQVFTLASGCHHLVSGDGNGSDLFALTRVLTDLVLGERRAPKQLRTPLAAGDRVGDQDQGRGAGVRHGGGPDNGLAGAAGQHHDTRATLPESRHRALLVAAQLPAVLAQFDRVRLTVDVTGKVLGRPADLE